MAQQTITALYDRYEDASAAVDALERDGIPRGDVSLVSNNADDRHAGRLAGSAQAGGTGGANEAAKDGAKDGTGAGASLGTVVGGAAGLLAGLGLVAIPGVGPVVAAGWLVATLTGAGIGAAAGGLAGALAGAGVNHTDAHTYGEGVRRGGTLVTVRVEDAQAARASRAAGILEQHGPVDIDQKAESWRAEGWTAPDSSSAAPRAPGAQNRVRSYPATTDL